MAGTSPLDDRICSEVRSTVAWYDSLGGVSRCLTSRLWTVLTLRILLGEGRREPSI